MNQHLVLSDLKHRLFKALQTKPHQDELPPALPISPWAAMSLLQKAIRRSDTDWALAAASTLLQISPERLWRRLSVIAFEDIGQGDLITVGHTIAATSGKSFRSQLGGDELVAAYIVRLQCEAAKCRAADDLAVICDWSPDLRDSRISYAEMSDSDLACIVVDGTKSLPERAIALWYLFGTDRIKANHLEKRPGAVDAGLEALSDLGSPATALEVARHGIRKGAGLLAAFYPLLMHLYATDEGEVFKLTKLEFPTVMVGRVPSFTFDMHVREGRSAIKQLLKVECATNKWAASVNPQWGQLELLYGMLFRKESAYTRHHLIWTTGCWLANLADWEVHGISQAELVVGYEALAGDMELLHRLRREAVGC